MTHCGNTTSEISQPDTVGVRPRLYYVGVTRRTEDYILHSCTEYVLVIATILIFWYLYYIYYIFLGIIELIELTELNIYSTSYKNNSYSSAGQKVLR